MLAVFASMKISMINENDASESSLTEELWIMSHGFLLRADIEVDTYDELGD